MSDLAAALATFDGFDQWMMAETSPDSVEEIALAEAMRTLAAAARQRLRLSRDDGGEWSAELEEVVCKAMHTQIDGDWHGCKGGRAVLDAVESYLIGAGKGSE